MSTDIHVIAELRDLISEFKERELRFFEAINNGESPVFEDIHNLIVKIKEKLANYDMLRIDDLSLRNDLCAIRDNRDFKYFKLIELLVEAGGSDGEAKPFSPNLSEEEWHDFLDKEILSKVAPYMMLERKMEIGSLLVGKTMPEHLKRHLSHIKECYIWGFDSAATIYCRTILEEGFKEALKSKPEFRTPEQKKELDVWPLNWLLKYLKKNKDVYHEVTERAYKIKENVNHTVHPTGARKPSVQMTAIEIIKDTFYILEMLFR